MIERLRKAWDDMSCISVKAYTQSENKIWLLINCVCEQCATKY
jgi:hypothetical protein